MSTGGHKALGNVQDQMDAMSLGQEDRSGRSKAAGDAECVYTADRVIGNGSFGVVFQATNNVTGETVAIKKVMQDRRYKNRELQIMQTVKHPNVVAMRDSFFSRGDSDVYLNVVMEYVPETIYQTIRNHSRARQQMPEILVKLYVYQLMRSLAYCHSLGICHRDIKPQNVLFDPQSHVVKLCDFGSAKMLVASEPNVAYICSRFYRAPELIFEATDYSVAIDVWSAGCVCAELLLAHPLFQGRTSVEQLVEIIKVLGAPTPDDIRAMNRSYTQYKFPQVTPHAWSRVFRSRASPEAIDLISKVLTYNPQTRLTALDCLAHPFFDELRKPDTTLPNGRPLPPLFNFRRSEIDQARERSPELLDKLLPAHLREEILAKAERELPDTPTADPAPLPAS